MPAGSSGYRAEVVFHSRTHGVPSSSPIAHQGVVCNRPLSIRFYSDAISGAVDSGIFRDRAGRSLHDINVVVAARAVVVDLIVFYCHVQLGGGGVGLGEDTGTVEVVHAAIFHRNCWV